jgi:hypothetical protein
MKIHYLALSAVLLSACAPMGSLVKESALGLTERDGREHFTFAGELPADFGIEVSARYYPLNPERCQTFSMGSGDYVVRDGYKQYEAEFKSKPSRFSFDIPLSRHIGLCNMQLGRIAFLMEGRYGEESWQRHGDHGVIGIAETRPEWAPQFDEQGTQHMRGYCTWAFQLSKAHSRQGLISKVLNCSRTDATWGQEADPYKRRSIGLTVGLDELPGKTVLLDMRVDPHERPATRETWIKFPEGWKPCAEEEVESGTWIWCRNPPTFRTFKMNGQECTVYPRCEE